MNFCTLLRLKCTKFAKFRAWKMTKMAVLCSTYFKNPQNWFHVKSEWLEILKLLQWQILILGLQLQFVEYQFNVQPSCGLNFESPSIVVQPQPHSSIIVDRGHHSIWLEVMRPLQRPSTKCHKHANSISHWGTEKCDGIKWGMVERKRRRSENGQFPQNFNAFLWSERDSRQNVFYLYLNGFLEPKKK